ncbi:MAG: helicase-related protein [Verrucomicrobiota bacterium]
MRILTGQRWASDPEPELGLGLVTGAHGGRVTVNFPATGEKRVYAWPGAPLARVIFHPGDRVEGPGGPGKVESVREENGLIFYQITGVEIPEAELSGLLARRGPRDRLESGQVDGNEDFELRREALFRRAHWQRSPVRGFQGARMELIPHQLGIVAEVSGRLRPRVLLADEVGLGKTIEACLILHRLHLTGRADRVLIAVPEPLVHQWFVELLRRFSLRFSIFDEERCEAIENEPEGEGFNPFLDSQLVLCGLNLLTGRRQRADQAVNAGWDLLIVDEAHRLTRVPAFDGDGDDGGSQNGDDEGQALEVIGRLAAAVPGVLLLSGTPQQSGWQGQFALLQLLDPARYAEEAVFHAESGHYGEIAQVIEHLDATGTLDPARLPPEVRDWPETLAVLADDGGKGISKNECHSDGEGGKSGGNNTPAAAAALRAALLDRCGIGRVMFRNVRSSLAGFPGREVHAAPLPDASGETRVRWLAELLRRCAGAGPGTGEKVLLICHASETAEQLRESLLGEIQVKTGVFHEGLNLLQRDRQAAWFSEEDGADILLCSEIGGEGRNFQFARHLVLWDLPDDPDVVEQRIGRLDRIGRRGTIQIHVPFAAGTAEEFLFRWMTEGLGLLHAPVSGASRMAEETAFLRRGVLENPTPEGLETLIRETRRVKERIGRELASGYDRLLQWQTADGTGDVMADRIRESDSVKAWETWCVRLLESLGMQVEPLRARHWQFQAGSAETESLPELPVEGLSAVFERAEALTREDAAFMTPDHPLPRGAAELLLGGTRGSAACGVVTGQNRPGLMLEVCYVLECVARPALQADRFLPSLPLRVAVDEKGADLSENQALLKLRVTDAEASVLKAAWPAVKHFDLPARAAALAAPRRTAAIAGALKKMNRALEADLTRQEILARRQNRPAGGEADELRARQAELQEAISSARLRMDSMRILVMKR